MCRDSTLVELQTLHPLATIISVPIAPQRSLSADEGASPFQPGSMVVITLANPREKFWGKLLALASEGMSICGIEVHSFDDLISLVKGGEVFSSVVFFPMHRVERVELDLPNGNIPSLSERFTSRTGRHPSATLRPRASGVPTNGEQK